MNEMFNCTETIREGCSLDAVNPTNVNEIKNCEANLTNIKYVIHEFKHTTNVKSDLLEY